LRWRHGRPATRGDATGRAIPLCYTPRLYTRPEIILSIPDNPNWHRHRNACPFYRERWTVEDEAGDDGCDLLYQIICLQNTPPVTPEEQELCMKARTRCWRLAEPAASEGRRGKSGAGRP
jgi:hypothetical protein